MDRQRRVLLVEEEEVEREAHAEGVDAGAARDQQAGPGFLALEEGQAQQTRAHAPRDWDLMSEHTDQREPA